MISVVRKASTNTRVLNEFYIFFILLKFELYRNNTKDINNSFNAHRMQKIRFGWSAKYITRLSKLFYSPYEWRTLLLFHFIYILIRGLGFTTHKLDSSHFVICETTLTHRSVNYRRPVHESSLYIMLYSYRCDSSTARA